MIAALPAERRWIMSGTPTVGKAVVGAGGALVQLERLLRFLREPRYGVAAAGGAKRWARDVSGPVARAADGATTKLIDLLQPLVVRHTKADLSLPEPIWRPVWSAVRSRMEEEGEVAVPPLASAAAPPGTSPGDGRREGRVAAAGAAGPRAQGGRLLGVSERPRAGVPSSAEPRISLDSRALHETPHNSPPTHTNPHSLLYACR